MDTMTINSFCGNIVDAREYVNSSNVKVPIIWKSQPIDLLWKSIDWFLYGGNFSVQPFRPHSDMGVLDI